MDKSESEGAHRTKLFWPDEIAREDRGTRGFIGNIRMSKQSQGLLFGIPLRDELEKEKCAAFLTRKNRLLGADPRAY